MPSNPKIIAAAVVHPDFLETSHIEKADKPILFSFTNTSNPLDRETRPWVESILGGPKGKPRTKYCIQMFATDLPEIGIGQNPAIENEGTPVRRQEVILKSDNVRVDYAMHESARAISEWFIRGAKLKDGPQ